MTRMFVLGGPYAVLIGLLAVLALVLSVKKALDLFARGAAGGESRSVGLDAILFCGCIGAVLGLLGQISGVYLSLMVISTAGAINPQLVLEGMAVSLIPLLFGLGLLVVTATVWFVLRCRLGSLAASAGAD